MATLSEEEFREAGASMKTGKEGNSTAPFPGLHSKFDTTSTVYTIYSHLGSSSVESDSAGDGSSAEARKTPELRRRHSEYVTPRVREQWGVELWSRTALQESMVLLRNSVASYEREASRQQWKDFQKIYHEVDEQSRLADSARKTKFKKGEGAEDVDALSRFSMVALEYTKMFDAVMNQSPEYAGLAWGVIRMLFVAHTNHGRLKVEVRENIIQFGQDFEVVNQLMMSHPTEKMVEAVCEAYSAFSTFLAKAVKYYQESRMMTAFKSLTFPWETKFLGRVTRIKVAVNRIKDLASAGQLGMAAHTNQMVATMGWGQERLRDEMHQSHIELRQQLKEEVRGEMDQLFLRFEKGWVSQFEQIMAHAQSIRGHVAAQIEPGKQQAASAGAQGNAGVTSASYLSDHVGTAKRLKRFRNSSFPLLKHLDNDQAEMNIRLRSSSNQDLQQVLALLRNDCVRCWLPASSSSLIWINTVKPSGPSDWATVFSIRMVEHATAIDDMVALYHLCGNHPTSSSVSTAAVMVQSLILQVVTQQHRDFVRQAPPFTLDHFQAVNDDINDLWELFLACCTEVKVHRFWLVLDRIDNLRQDEDYDLVLQALVNLVASGDSTFKVLCSTRISGTPKMISDAAESSPAIYTVTVPKRIQARTTTGLSRQRRAARLPEQHSPERPLDEAASVDIDALLHSSSEDEDILYRNGPVTGSQPNKATVDHEWDDNELESDDSMEFMRNNPLAWTDNDDDDDDRETDAVVSSRWASDGGEDSDDDFLFTRPKIQRAPSGNSDPLAESESSDHSSDDRPTHSVPISNSQSPGRRQWLMQRTASLRSRRRPPPAVKVTVDRKGLVDSASNSC